MNTFRAGDPILPRDIASKADAAERAKQKETP